MQLQIFKYQEENHLDDLTTIDIDGEIWFVASEVCKLLDIKNPRQATASLDEDEKSSVVINDGTSGNPNKTIVSESGLYTLIFKSVKPNAKKFRKWVTKEVIPSIRKTGGFGIPSTHAFVRRFNENWDRVDRGYFSVISELFVRLYGKFEMIGYVIPEKTAQGIELRPDNSVGRLFSAWLKKNHPEKSDDHKPYDHLLPNGLIVPARQYKLDLLHLYIDYVENVWMPERAPNYFEERAPIALDYLPKLLPGYKKPEKLSRLNLGLEQALNYDPSKDRKES